MFSLALSHNLILCVCKLYLKYKKHAIYIFSHLNISNQLRKFHGDIYYLKNVPYTPVVSPLNCLFMIIMQIAQSDVSAVTL